MRAKIVAQACIIKFKNFWRLFNSFELAACEMDISRTEVLVINIVIFKNKLVWTIRYFS